MSAIRWRRLERDSGSLEVLVSMDDDEAIFGAFTFFRKGPQVWTALMADDRRPRGAVDILTLGHSVVLE